MKMKLQVGVFHNIVLKKTTDQSVPQILKLFIEISDRLNKSSTTKHFWKTIQNFLCLLGKINNLKIYVISELCLV